MSDTHELFKITNMLYDYNIMLYVVQNLIGTHYYTVLLIRGIVKENEKYI